MHVDVLLDTNVFLYHLDDSDARKHAIATGIVRDALLTRQGCISYQVIQECLNVALRQAQIPLDHAGAANYLSTVLVPLWHVMPTAAFYRRGIDVQARYGFHFYGR